MSIDIDSDNFGSVTDFNFKDITNGGANRFWFNENADTLMIAGSDVGGREAYDDANAFFEQGD